jgi:hypothetical protein
MLELKCNRCGDELKEPGALVFSPPTGDGWLVEKFHLCVDCWSLVSGQLKARSQSKDPERTEHAECRKENP